MRANTSISPRSSKGEFFQNDTGVAAVEFALVLPVILLLMLGATDVTEAVSARRKVTLVANTAADLIGQVSEVDNGYLNNVFMATSAVGAPLNASNMTVVITSVVVDSKGIATVAWSQGKNKAPRVAKAAFPLANDLKSLPTLDRRRSFVQFCAHHRLCLNRRPEFFGNSVRHAPTNRGS